MPKTVVKGLKAWIDVVITESEGEYSIDIPDYAYANWPPHEKCWLSWEQGTIGMDNMLVDTFQLGEVYSNDLNPDKVQKFLTKTGVSLGVPFRCELEWYDDSSYSEEYGNYDYGSVVVCNKISLIKH